MGALEDFQERLARYRRIFSRKIDSPEIIEDLKKTLAEVDARMGLNQNVFGVLNAREGWRLRCSERGS